MRFFRRWKAVTFTLLLLAALTATQAFALSKSTLDTITADLAPLDGYVIMPIGSDFLIDIDASKGAKIGDLLSVIQPGEKIIHPITGETLGSLTETLAILRLTKIKSGYSYAEKLSGSGEITKGSRIKRFSSMTAWFDGQGQDAEKTYRQLTAALPGLDWQGFSSGGGMQGPAADIRFTLNPDLLEVRSSTGLLIHSYPVSASVIRPAAAPVALVTRQVTLPTPQVALPITLPPVSTPAVKWEKPKPNSSALIRYAAEYSENQHAGSLPGSTLMASFTEVDGGLLLATTDGTKVSIYRMKDGLVPLAEYSFSNRSIHALSWWRPASGKTYLAVSGTSEGAPTASTSTETNPSSTILAWTAGRLSPVADYLDYFLGSFDRNGDGSRETLLGQSLDLEIFNGRIRELQLNGNSVRSSAPAFKLPYQFPVQGSLFADLTGDGKLESVAVNRGLLTVYRGTKVIYQSKKEMGGSISQLTYDINPGQIDALFTSVSFEVPPIAADIDGDGQLELVVISSDHPTIITPGSGSDIAEAWLSVIKYQDGRFVKGTLGTTFESPLQGLYAEKDRILLISSTQQDSDSSSATSSLLTIPLGGKK